MVELLVVIMILSILVGLVMAVGHYVTDEAARKNTVASQAIIMSAINTYYTTYAAYPSTDAAWVTEMSNDANSMAVLSLLPKQAGVNGTPPILLDGWGRKMTYSPNSGFGGRPQVVSAGPDGTAGNADDIRSDK